MYSLICIIVAKDSTLCEFTIQKNSTIYIFGEKSFSEKRCIDGDFISSCNEFIEEAKLKLEAQAFPEIEGDETKFIPYP